MIAETDQWSRSMDNVCMEVTVATGDLHAGACLHVRG
jgi:hypothetical protein